MISLSIRGRKVKNANASDTRKTPNKQNILYAALCVCHLHDRSWKVERMFGREYDCVYVSESSSDF